jgi:mono/diheme cytochrome c family protein
VRPVSGNKEKIMQRMLWVLAFAFASSLATAGDQVSETAKLDFVAYCASCHGVDGTGNGPLADTLKIKPTDLTVISKKNEGHFPYTMLRKTIEGRELGLARAHGPREMPVWGPIFSQVPETPTPGGSGGDYSGSFAQCVNLAARARVMNIVDYIESIQK